MSIYKGLLMLQGYLTTVEPSVEEQQGRGAAVPGACEAPGGRAASPRRDASSLRGQVPVGGECAGLAGGCC